MIQHLSPATFDEIANAGDTVVDFWADWCGPCKAMEPILEDLAAAREGSLTVAKVNIDEHPDLAARFGVMSLPTFIVFSNGEVVGQISGARSAETLAADIDRALS